jgi:phage-related minor tail protein
MKAMAKSVIDSLIKMLIQKYIVDAAFGAITGFIGNTQRGVNSSFGYGASLGGADPFNTSNFAPRAIGGSVQSGQPYMVGERGPEMFVPNSQGSIVPTNKMGGGGGVVVNQTINVTTGVQQTVRAEIATLMPQIANAAKGAVADAKMRGGNYSKMLGA